jgi:tetratricopeptide (TPR) repeat protein
MKRLKQSATSVLLIAALPFSLSGAGFAQAPAAAQPAQQQSAPAQPATPPAQQAQPASSAAPPAAAPVQQPKANTAKAIKQPKPSERRRAAKLFLEATKLFDKEEFEEAYARYQQAATLDPTDPDYTLAAEVARSHAVTALIQTAVHARMKKDAAGARAALTRALELDPTNRQVAERLRQLGGDAVRSLPEPLYSETGNDLGDVVEIAPTAGAHSFNVRTGQRQVIQQVFKAYGIDATLDDSVRGTQVRLDLENATFQEATRVLELLTGTFYAPIDPHRVLVAQDNEANRAKFEHQQLETIYLPGLSATELTDMTTMAKNVFSVTQVVAEQSAGTLTVRAPHETMAALNETLRELIDGRDQVMLDIRLIQIAHTSAYNTGAQLPQQLTAFNVYAEEQQILTQNASLVQQIISSGLAAPGDTEAIIAILIASGQVTSALFSNGFALFGGGLTLSAFSPPPVTANFSLNSSDSRELDQIQLHLGDGEAGTLKTGMRYPIMTSSYSSLGSGGVNIPGLNLPGSSAGLGGLASELGLGGSTAGIVPQVQYEDLGLTLKATPKVLRSNQVALTIDLKIDALAGSSINGVPVLNNQAYTGVVTLPAGEGVVVLSELNKQQSRAISGVPGLSEIPGLNDLTEKDTQTNYATLLIVMTPHVIRLTQPAGHSPMMRIEAKRQGSAL